MARCLFPFTVKNPKAFLPREMNYIPVPCGTCPACKKNRINGWAFRLEQQLKKEKNALFVTLTYHTAPISDNGLLTLDYSDVQRFIKRLRYFHPKSAKKISYYCVGEYGSKRNRPHYHLIMFNVQPEFLDMSWSKYVNPSGSINGDVWFEVPRDGAVRYTLKYVAKEKRIPMFEKDDRKKEMSRMSKGLGESYLTDDIIAYHKADVERRYVTLPDGFKAPLPRYYRNRIYSDVESASYNRKIQQTENDLELQRQREYEQRNGSLDGYYKEQYEDKKNAIHLFNRESNSRKDL